MCPSKIWIRKVFINKDVSLNGFGAVMGEAGLRSQASFAKISGILSFWPNRA